jgi:hypothetical protein
MPIYNLFLSTSLPSTSDGYKDDAMIIAGKQHGAPPVNGYGSEFWFNINWDKLFGGDNYNPEYTKCRVYSKIINHRGNGDSTYGFHTGRVSTNLTSANYLPGTCIGNPLCSYYYDRIGTGPTEYISIFNTENITGMEIDIPRGISELCFKYAYITRTQTIEVVSNQQRTPFYLLYFELF